MDAAPVDALARFQLLASAIAGRVVEVAPAAPGDSAWTDGATLFVDAGATGREQLCAIVVQSALLGAGSLEAGIAANLRRPALAQRYLAVEGHRALLAAHETLLPPAALGLIDPAIVARTDSPAASLELARSRAPIAAPPDSFGTIRARALRLARADAAADGAGASPDTTASRRGDQAGRALTDDDEFGVELFSNPVGGGGPIGRLLQRMLADGRSRRGGAPPGAGATEYSSDRAARRARPAARRAFSALAPMPLGDGVVGGARAVTYPEWDTHAGRYRLDWCTVVEPHDAPGKASGGSELERPPDTRALRRPLARLGLGLDRCHRQMQGDEVDLDAAVDARAQAAAGAAPDEAVYIESQRRRRELAVLVLLDVSGSAADASASGATVHQHQRSAAGALTIALHEFGDRAALYAFRSRGRSAVEVMPLKRFDAPLGAPVLRRLAAIAPGGYTRLGAAVRHSTALLEAGAGTPRRLLVVVSDGFVYDHGYDGAYGEADARRALGEARRRGIGCLCLTIGAGPDPAALRSVFGTAAHAMIPRSDDLPTVVGPLFRAALRTAELQHRRSLRQQRARRAPRDRQEDRVTDGARPYYVAVGNEEQVFKAAFRQGLSILLKGPTGCGKTRFVEAMAHDVERPLVTVACHDDLTTADLVGRFLLQGGDTNWVDGPLTRAVREGAICYLDEIVEARQDTTVVLHPLADHRRELPIDRLGVTLNAAPGFCLVVSYNPGYQSVLKDLKDSTRQRMVAIEFDFPPVDVEGKIVAHEARVDGATAARLVQLGQAIRRLDTAGLREVASTRVLVAAGRLVTEGLPVRDAAKAAVAGPLTDDPAVTTGLFEMIDAYLAE